MSTKYGLEHYSSIQEFEVQFALGTVSEEILGEIAYDEETPEEILDLLATQCESRGVKISLCENRSTPGHAINAILKKDTHNRICEAAANNPNATEDILITILTHSTDEDTLEQAVLHKNMTSRALKSCINYLYDDPLKEALYKLYNDGWITIK